MTVLQTADGKDGETQETPSLQADRAPFVRLAVVPNSDRQRPSVTGGNRGRALLDDSGSGLDAALARALHLAVSRGKLELVDRILSQIEQRAEGKRLA
jgi:hypothetical protein